VHGGGEEGADDVLARLLFWHQQNTTSKDLWQKVKVMK
jgi:hypothetical protein